MDYNYFFKRCFNQYDWEHTVTIIEKLKLNHITIPYPFDKVYPEKMSQNQTKMNKSRCVLFVRIGFYFVKICRTFE